MAPRPTAPEPTIFRGAPRDLGPDELAARLVADLDGELHPACHEARTFHDTPDWRVHRGGWVLETVPDPRGEWVVTLRDRGAAPGLLRAPAPAPPVFARDLPRGRLRDLVGPALDVRALRPLTTITAEVHPVTVRNREGKAVARLAVEQWRGDHDEPVVTWVWLTPVRGYPKEAGRAREWLDRAGLQPAATDPAEHAIESTGSTPGKEAGRLPRRLDGAGPAATAFVACFQALLEGLEANLEGAIEGIDIECLHDFRTGLRRLRAGLAHAKGVVPEELRACFRPELAWLHRVTGPARDLDVMDLWISLLVPGAAGNGDGPSPLRPVAERVAHDRDAARRQMVSDLRSARAVSVLADWGDTLAHLRASAHDPVGADAGEWGPWPDLAAQPLTDVVDRRIRRSLKAVRDGFGSARKGAVPIEVLHDLRKQGKDLRSLLELFAAAYGTERVRDMVKELKGMQDVLGALNDADVQEQALLALLDEVGSGAGAEEAAAALTSLASAAARRQEAARAAAGPLIAPVAARRW
ncbi:MAG: CHAD domain-containing protein [Acidimicrobiia bacterium]